MRFKFFHLKLLLLVLLLPALVLLIRTFSFDLRPFITKNNLITDVISHKRAAGPVTEKIEPQNIRNIMWVIPSTSRAWVLDLTLNSMKNEKVLVSRDPKRTDIDAIIKRYGALAVDPPHLCGKYDKLHPDFTDKRDVENQRDKLEKNPLKWPICAKNIWFEMMRKAWDVKPEVVCVSNENIIIHPMAKEWLEGQLLNDNEGVKLTSRDTVPWCMSRKLWNRLESGKDMFCMKNGNWDVTIAEMLYSGNMRLKNRAIVPSEDLSFQLDGCDERNAERCSDEKKEDIRRQVAEWASKDHGATMARTDALLTSRSIYSGDFGQLSEHAHCKGICTGFQFKPTSDQRVYINQPPKGGDAFLLDLGPVCLDMSKVTVSKGGENVTDVLNRPEDDEFPQYEKGAWTMDNSNILASPKYYQKHILKAATTWEKRPVEFDITGTTIAYQRIEYANVCLTTIDWFNLYLTLQHISSGRLLWLDGHASGHLDEVWSKLFGIDVVRMGKLTGKVCFERLVLMPKVSPLYDIERFGNCDFFDFMRQMLRAYNVTSNGPKHDTVIIRDYYLAHPRVSTFVDRKFDEGTLLELHDILPNARFVRFHELKWRDQLQLVLNTNTLYGIHGAGSMFGLFMQPGSKLVEWVVDSRRQSYGFQHMMTWRPDVEYERIDLKIWLKKNKQR